MTISEGSKSVVKLIVKDNEIRKKRMLHKYASQFDYIALTAIENALCKSCANIEADEPRKRLQEQIYKSIVNALPYESLIDTMCGRRQFYEYRNEFIELLAKELNIT